MTADQGAVFAILACTMLLFIWGRIRYDLVAVMALLASVFSGIVPAEKAFVGFSHAAVVTVAAVLVISKALENSGIVNYLVELLAPTRTTTTLQVGRRKHTWGSIIGHHEQCRRSGADVAGCLAQCS